MEPHPQESQEVVDSNHESEDTLCQRDSAIEEPIDPRIGEKLEELNSWMARINHLEKQFEAENGAFRSILTDYSDKLKFLSNTIGIKWINEARKYYELKERSRQAQVDCQKTVMAYEKSCQLLLQAKDQIEMTEKKFLSNSDQENCPSTFDTTWQEVLNKSMIKLAEAEKLKTSSKIEHEMSMKLFMDLEEELSIVVKKSKQAIKKSREYFDESFKFKQHLIKKKQEIELLNEQIIASKSCYALTLKDLEMISEEIHERRNSMVVKSLLGVEGINNLKEIEDDASGYDSNCSSIENRESLADDSFDYSSIVPELNLQPPIKMSKPLKPPPIMSFAKSSSALKQTEISAGGKFIPIINEGNGFQSSTKSVIEPISYLNVSKLSLSEIKLPEPGFYNVDLERQ